MKTKVFNAILIDVVANKDGDFIRTTKGVDNVDHVSITGLFVEKPEAGKRAGSDEFQVNFQAEGKKRAIYKALKKIADLEVDSDDRDKAINDFNSLEFEVSTLRMKCPLYFVHYMVKGKAKRKTFLDSHPDKEKAGQPQFGDLIVDYWVGDESAGERFDKKIVQIQNNKMFVTATNSEDILDDIKSDAVREMMDLAIIAHQRRVDALKAKPAVKPELKDTKKDDTVIDEGP